eukprot:GFKZ01002412.1.p1 GENE.GFKZ01002412.1~~GFKZ01002412.1.p1  ORF type:complete len:449 (+),score=58.74 GFKZ01002412.1:133-1347(+)
MGIPNYLQTLSDPPTDPILSIASLFHSDPHPTATNLSIGAFLTADGLPHEFQTIALARHHHHSLPADHSYLPLTGLPALLHQIPSLLHPQYPIAAIQTVSGSGAVRLALTFASNLLHSRRVLVAQPTWPNHIHIAKAVGLRVGYYRYYDAASKRIDVEAMLSDLALVSDDTVIIMQACAHNPTGMDLDDEQWGRVGDVLSSKQGVVVVMDMAYLGLASGTVEADGRGVRLLREKGILVLVAMSFSKNMGVYNSRVGVLSVECSGGEEEARRVQGWMAWFARGMYSSAPAEGARWVSWVLENKRGEWEGEVQDMVKRLVEMRARLRQELERSDKGDWSYITRGKGMFVLLGLQGEQVERLRKQHHVYLTSDSRLNVAGLTDANVARVADAIAEVMGDPQHLQVTL